MRGSFRESARSEVFVTYAFLSSSESRNSGVGSDGSAASTARRSALRLNASEWKLGGVTVRFTRSDGTPAGGFFRRLKKTAAFATAALNSSSLSASADIRFS